MTDLWTFWNNFLKPIKSPRLKLVASHDVFVKIFSVQASSCQGYIWGCGVTQVPTDLTTTCAEAAAATSLVPDKKRPTRCPARFTLFTELEA